MTAIIIRRVIGLIVLIGGIVAGYYLRTHKKNDQTKDSK